MANSEVEEEGLALLSVAIGMIMEDHADEAVTALPARHVERRMRFTRLRQAGADIVALAGAADALLRMGEGPGGQP